MGAFFGLATYVTYDLTNLATVKDWPFIITIVDLIWGMIFWAAALVITYFIAVKQGDYELLPHSRPTILFVNMTSWLIV